MYRILRNLGSKGDKGVGRTQISSEEFKDHFAWVFRDRSERDPSLIEDALEEHRDLRGLFETWEAIVLLKELTEEEEILKKMRNVKDSALEEEDVRMR